MSVYEKKEVERARRVGMTITFSPEELRGGISMLLGSVDPAGDRDYLVVMPFTCQKR